MTKKALFGLSVFLLACNSSQKEDYPAPKDLIAKEQLIPVIIDLQVLESHYHRLYNRPDAYKNAVDSASFFVFEKYGTTKEQFKQSYTYYAYDVNEMFLIYEATLDSINLKVSQTGEIQ